MRLELTVQCHCLHGSDRAMGIAWTVLRTAHVLYPTLADHCIWRFIRRPGLCRCGTKAAFDEQVVLLSPIHQCILALYIQHSLVIDSPSLIRHIEVDRLVGAQDTGE